MAELKTTRNGASVTDFLNAIPDETKRRDAFRLLELFQRATKAGAHMWGSGIVGFGQRRLVYENGRELDWMLVGFSPRKQNFALYLGKGFKEYDTLTAKLGNMSSGKGCTYIKKLADVDVTVLEKLIERAAAHARGEG